MLYISFNGYIISGDEYSTMVIKLYRWIVFGVLFSVLPFMLMVIRNWVINHEIFELEYLLDLLLITFAIAVNALSLIADNGKQIHTGMRIVCGGLSGLSMLICASLYFSFFEYCQINDKILEQFIMFDDSLENIMSNEDVFRRLEILKQMKAELNPRSERLIAFIILSAAILILNLIIGIVVEIVDERRNRYNKINLYIDGNNESEKINKWEGNHEEEVPV